MKIRFVLCALSALLFTSPASAIPTAPSGPIDAWFHFSGIREFVVFETRYEYSAAEEQFVGGETIAVDGGISSADLWITAWFDDFQHDTGGNSDEWTATGKIVSIGGTPAGARLSDPLTAAVLLAPFELSVFQSSAQIIYTVDMDGKWATGVGEVQAEAITLEDDPEGNTFVTSGLLYEFSIEGAFHSDGTNTVTAREIYEPSEIQGPLPLIDGQVLLRTRVASVFQGSLVEKVIHPTSIPEPATLAIFGIGLAGLGFTRRRKAV